MAATADTTRSSYVECQTDAKVFGSQKTLIKMHKHLKEVWEDNMAPSWLGHLVMANGGDVEELDCYAFLNEKPVLYKTGNVVEFLILSISSEFLPPVELFEWIEKKFDVEIDWSCKEPQCGVFLKKNDRGYFNEEYAAVLSDGDNEECYTFEEEDDIYDCLGEAYGITDKKALSKYKREHPNVRIKIYKFEEWEAG